MGNSGSHNSTQADEQLHQSWAHSFPRDIQRTSQLKVLPDLDGGARLRITNNGTILHSGGTISGRKEGGTNVHRSRSVSSQHHPHVPSYRDPLHRSQNHLNLHGPGSFAAQAKRFGSEPDLRMGNIIEEYNAGARHRISREKKKKGKAPPPPNLESSPDSDRFGRKTQVEVISDAPRKLRLFKTRAESKPNIKKDYQQYDIGKRELDREDLIPADVYDTYDQDAFSRRDVRRKISNEDRRKDLCERRRSAQEDRIRIQLEDRKSAPESRRQSGQEEFRRSFIEERRQFDESKVLIKDDQKRIVQDDRKRTSRMELRRISQFDNKKRERESRSQERSSIDFMKNERDDRMWRMPEFEIARPEFRRQKSFDQSLYTEKYSSRNAQNFNSDGKNHADNLILKSSAKKNEDSPNKKGIASLVPNGITRTEFQKELKLVTKLRGTKTNVEHPTESPNNMPIKKTPDEKNKNKVKTMDLDNRKNLKDQYNKTNEFWREEQKNLKNSDLRGQASGKESTPGNSPSRIEPQNNWESSPIIKAIQDRPPKTFYFGMDEQDNNNCRPDDVVEQFAASLMQKNRAHRLPASSESALSSEAEDDLQLMEANTHGLDLQLRPTLPKKQLEIPRFSPAAAWRLLSNLEGHDISTLPTDDGPILEDRIERLPRINQAGPTHDNKSGDSGISGDAGPVDITDCSRSQHISKNMINAVRPMLSTWTPQQDLGEESSSDGGLDSQQSTPTKTPIGVSSKAHVFSLSLPRENHIATYTDKSNKQPYNSLHKIKRSVSGALNGVLSTQRPASDNPSGGSVGNNGSANWYLSRSAPTSLDNGQMSPAHLDKSSESPSDPDEDSKPLRQRPFSYLSNHVMYLPMLQASSIQEQKGKLRAYKSLEPDVVLWNTNNNLDKNDNILEYNKFQFHEDNTFVKNNERKSLEQDPRKRNSNYANIESKKTRTKSREEPNHIPQKINQIFSKSCSNLTNDLEDLQDPPPQNQMKFDKPKSKTKKFTFQSTVRQIERKRLAEKLSKEAEQKEKQRLSELEAMRRVEEEFQKKRAREKASIRQQLRMYNLEDKESNNLLVTSSPTRADPDGAVSSPAPSPQNPSREHFSKSSLLYHNMTQNTKNITNNFNMDINDRKNIKYSKCSGASEDHSYKYEKENKIINKYDDCLSHYKNIDHKSGKDYNKKYHEKSGYDHQTPYISKLVEQKSSQRRGRERMPTTEILSEFRQPRREYLEYRSRGDSPCTQQLIHPEVVGNIPASRSPQIYHNDTPTTPLSDNYRKEFARGRSVGSSDSERSMPSVTARQQHRSRSASPDISRNDGSYTNSDGASIEYGNIKGHNGVRHKNGTNTQDRYENDDIIVPMFKKRPSLLLSGIADFGQNQLMHP